MYNYLPIKEADCFAEILSIRSTTVLPQTGEKNQVIHEFDDGTVSVVGVSSASRFDIVLQWVYLSDVDHARLLDLWHNPLLGDGRARTFYWQHPIDDHIYVIRFMGPLTSSYKPSGNRSVSQVPILVEGVSI